MGEYTDTVRAEQATELERLGSDRGLIALTAADLSESTIRRRIAETDLAAASVLGNWEGFAEVAESKRSHAERIAEPLSDPIEPADEGPLTAFLETCEGDHERVGAGMVGSPLVLDGWYLQAVSYFVNEANEAAADEFRTVRSETRTLRERGEERLDALDDPDRAVAAAVSLVDGVYAWYVETLEEMGLDPKTVC